MKLCESVRTIYLYSTLDTMNELLWKPPIILSEEYLINVDKSYKGQKEKL